MSTTVAADPAGQPVTLSTNDDDEADLPNLRSDSLTQLEWGPIEHLAYYSCDESDRVSFDLSCLHSFSQPSLPANLARGRELFYQRNKHNRSLGHPIPLDNLVRACLALGKETELHSADIITWRGVLVKLMLGIRMDLKFYIEDNALYIMEYDKKPHNTWQPIEAGISWVVSVFV
ncbi:hypothetical protein BDY19DRAFT_924050 [Irpex rosettiformis]|uniref:Uncharacterized protein n=1 Tax=Irpex rosettiformis TaxID=378272 RepID=A0ACB8UEG3_9APHY|nr:hypothetical protein BDY19DRAFT_924050 [Irpex rosettiformis]